MAPVPRPVDPDNHRRQRARITAAAAEQFATRGYERTSTAVLCRAAGVSSGTFFHYFPRKLDVLVAVLAEGRDATLAMLGAVEGDGLAAVLAYCDHLDEELAGAGFAGFAGSVAAVESEPEVAAVLAEEQAAVRGFLAGHLDRAQRAAEVRGDVPAERLATWVGWLLDGAAVGAVERPGSAGTPRGLAAAVRALVASAG